MTLCKEENGGTRASSRVFGLVEVRWRTNTSFSHLEVACFREQFGDWNPLVAQDGIVRGRPRKEPAPPPPVLIGENTQKHNPDLPEKTEDKHSETPKETDDTNDADNVPVSETPTNDGRDARYIKSKSSVDAADGLRQCLKFDGEASGMTPDSKR